MQDAHKRQTPGGAARPRGNAYQEPAGGALVLPCVSAEAMKAHLAEISTQIAAGAHAILILDGAGCHQSRGRPRLPNNISLLKPPPHCPELNPVENIREFSQGKRTQQPRLRQSLTPAATPGTPSSQTQNASPPLPNANGHRSQSDAVGVIRSCLL